MSDSQIMDTLERITQVAHSQHQELIRLGRENRTLEREVRRLREQVIMLRRENEEEEVSQIRRLIRFVRTP